MGHRRHRPGRPIGLGLCAVVAAATVACGLRATNERPTFEQLDPHEQDVVSVVLEELSSFNQQVTRLSDFDIGSVVDRERINVSFEGVMIAANLGDGLVHVAAWENLSARQHELVRSWFAVPDLTSARASYERLFYRFMAASQGVKQYMYEALTTEWVFSHRSVYTVERDSVRVSLAHFAEVGRKAEMWSFMNTICEPLVSQYEPVYGATFSKQYFLSNFRQLLGEGKTPTGYMYYLCRWVELGQETASDLQIELEWLNSLAVP